MKPPLVCTAGINLGTLRHVRPQPQSGQITTAHLHENGGILRLGRVIRFASARPTPRKPEVEDTRATFRTAQVMGEMTAADFWDRMGRVAHRGNGGLRGAFGEELNRVGLTHAVAVGSGSASLGILRCASNGISLTVRGRTQYNEKPQVRLSVDAGVLDPPPTGRSDLPVTDIRFYAEDHSVADEQAAADANLLLRNSREVMLAVGLSRPFAKGAGEAMHWLQVNGVFPSVDPLWGA